MTAVVLCCVFILWPVIALLGGQAYAPLMLLAVIPTLHKSLPALRPRLYAFVLLAFFLFAAASLLWSARAFVMGEPNFIKAGMALAGGGALIGAAATLDDKGRRLVQRVAAWAFLAQLLIVAVLTVFETQAIKLIYGTRPDDEGVQNISRNCLIMATVAPFMIAGFVQGRSPPVAIAIAIGLLAIVSAILLKREVDAGLLAIVAGAVFVAMVYVLPRFAFRIMGGLIALAVVAAPLWSWAVSRGANFASAVSSADYREIIWHRVLLMVADKPVNGGGVGVLRGIRERIPEGAFKGELVVPNHPHNMPLQLWAETGAIGAALLAAAILLAAWRLPRPEKLGMAAALIAALAGSITVMGCVSFDLWNEWWWGACSFLAALIAVWTRPGATSPARPA